MSALYFLCVYVYVVYVHVCMCAGVLKVCIHVDVRSLPQSLFTQFTEADSAEPRELLYSLSSHLAPGAPCLPHL